MHSLAIHQLDALNNRCAHQAPMTPFTIGQAHEVMRVHIACRAKKCPRKAVALHTLIDACRVVSSTSKPR
jgi:hypothetical protein